MKTSDFYFDLPPELIAQYPTEKRGDSRLLVYKRNSSEIIHSNVKDFPDYLDKNSCIVFNNTRVRKARLFGISDNGGKTEFLLLLKISDSTWSTICSKTKKQKIGKTFTFPDGITGKIIDTEDKNRLIEFSHPVNDEYLEKYGHMPLPPYIKREDILSDSERYQTVYSKKTGSAAAPTAGLHFTDEIIQKIREKGIEICFITLHVGMGTFHPVRSEFVEDHKMHEEFYDITPDTADRINRCRASGGRIVAIGTTSLRALESSTENGKLVSGNNSTSLFIYPGYKFKMVDHLFTNFHTPDSSLILLVSAFAGSDQIKKIYSEAVNARYRFFSYGDAVFLV
ncbi:MAG: tRNA preQ1(34) S-adenosylmethionine ribosyltransferase-isomerase QueA [Spirochaetales bacterium]|nr:tRNA preQ1(34) S-adenosylmethionine ribosyltransferase-isomerase QueA [Spirochaetales bacterium]